MTCGYGEQLERMQSDLAVCYGALQFELGT